MSKPRGLRFSARARTRVVRMFPRALARFGIFKVEVFGREFIPPKGQAVIVACNHISMADPVYVWGAMRRATVTVAMAELWRWPLVGAMMRDLGQIPVDRKSRTSGARVIRLAIRILKHGGLLLIFPEGKCSKTGELLPFKRGVVELAFETMSPVVPAGIRGTNKVLPLGSKKLNRHAQVHLNFGGPMHPRTYLRAAHGNLTTAKEQFMGDLRYSIQELSTTDYSKMTG